MLLSSDLVAEFDKVCTVLPLTVLLAHAHPTMFYVLLVIELIVS